MVFNISKLQVLSTQKVLENFYRIKIDQMKLYFNLKTKILEIFNENYNTVYKFPTLENFFLSFGSRYLFLNLKFLGVTSNNSSELI